MSVAYDVTISTHWTQTRQRWTQHAASTTCSPFQTVPWLDAWYTSFASQGEPLLIDVLHNGDIAALFPCVVTRRGAQRVLEFADLGVSDFNAPILGRAAPATAVDATRLWRTVMAALPSVDLVDFRKMPLTVAGRANPLALLDGLATSPMTGHLIDIADWDTYQAGLDRRVRMEFERSRMHTSSASRMQPKLCTSLTSWTSSSARG
jgi:CelD/BcsL family acetyltransferase involved in cellulose biosynthesis